MAFSGAGCVSEQLIAPTATQYVVHAVLDPSSPVQVIRVEQAVTGQPDDVYGIPCVRGALVTITTPEGVVMEADSPSDDSPPCFDYTVTPAGHGVTLVPGASYHLRVVVPGGATVTGVTTIPGATATSTLGPLEPFSWTRDSLVVAVVRVPGATTHQLRVRARYRTFSRFLDGRTVVPGTQRNDYGDRVFNAGDTAMVTVAAVDDNYYDYYRTSSDPLGGSPTVSRLAGGWGVFGSIVVVERRALVVVP